MYFIVLACLSFTTYYASQSIICRLIDADGFGYTWLLDAVFSFGQFVVFQLYILDFPTIFNKLNTCMLLNFSLVAYCCFCFLDVGYVICSVVCH